MSEIEKLYENAGIKPLSQMPDVYSGFKNICEDFTAEKQIELMAFIINTGIQVNLIKKEEITVNAIAEGLACATNEIWFDLTKEEQQQVKEILQ